MPTRIFYGVVCGLAAIAFVVMNMQPYHPNSFLMHFRPIDSSFQWVHTHDYGWPFVCRTLGSSDRGDVFDQFHLPGLVANVGIISGVLLILVLSGEWLSRGLLRERR